MTSSRITKTVAAPVQCSVWLYGTCIQANPISGLAALGQEHPTVKTPPVLGERERRRAAPLMIDPGGQSKPRGQRTENPRRQHRDRHIVLIFAAGSRSDVPRHLLLRAVSVFRVEQTLLAGQQTCQEEGQARP